ncbi:cytochrome P450 [Catenuloplanes japonicus]|uniref:cytochrome P450 n=1 Tax=Catenuloplanes japonicus TaxID=33876 RepID=UPI00052737E2|nr:cytochrome P450 [Catenuloplanes japonicus]
MTAGLTAPRTVRTVRDLTGPRGMPVFGNLPELLLGRDEHRAFNRWADRHGPTYLMRYGRDRVVVTGDGPTVSAALRDRPDGFRRVGVNKIFRELGIDGVFNAEGDRWRHLRKMAAQSLNAAYLREYFTSITRSATRLQTRWTASSGRPVDVLDDMMRFTLDVTTALAIGHDLNSLEATGDGLHTRLAELFPEIGRRIQAPFPYHRFVRLPRDRRRESAVREVDALVRIAHVQAKERMATGASPRTFLEALAVGPDFTHEELVGNVMTMLLAGEDTTSSSAAWTLHYLATHPEAQERVRQEALAAFGPDGMPTDPSSIRKLEFAEACVNEAMRLRPVAPTAGLRALRDTVLPGTDHDLKVPRGTSLILLLSYGAESVPDADEFRPERWLGGNPPPASAPLLPFGAGPRFCPGRNLALLEATLVAALACRDFTITPGGGRVKEKLAFAAFPKGLRLRITTVNS